jgi:hypothetical protein
MPQAARIWPALTEPILGSAKRTSRTLAVRTHSGGWARICARPSALSRAPHRTGALAHGRADIWVTKLDRRHRAGAGDGANHGVAECGKGDSGTRPLTRSTRQLDADGSRHLRLLVAVADARREALGVSVPIGALCRFHVRRLRAPALCPRSGLASEDVHRHVRHCARAVRRTRGQADALEPLPSKLRVR